MLTPANIVEQEMSQEDSVRLVALPGLQNARQVVPRKRNARQEVLHTVAFVRPAALPEQNAWPAVCRKNRYLNNIPEFIVLLKMKIVDRNAVAQIIAEVESGYSAFAFHKFKRVYVLFYNFRKS